MNIQEKLQVIKKFTGLSQTKLAEHFGVSFPAFNNWWNGKSSPRPKMRILIDDFFLEVTGQKVIPVDQLTAKKKALEKKSGKYSNIIKYILDNPDIRDRLILKLTYNSNRIEGSTLTEPDTAAILFNNAALPDKSLTEQMEAKNHQTALNYLFKYIVDRGKINEKLILRLHSILMNGIRQDAGAYRNHGVRILGVSLATANHLKVPKLISEIITEANKKSSDIVYLSSLVHAKFEKVHPFSDGNGRIGRLLMSAMLLKVSMAPAIINQRSKRIYYAYLFKAQTKNDQSQLEGFICDAILDGFHVLERKDIK